MHGQALGSQAPDLGHVKGRQPRGRSLARPRGFSMGLLSRGGTVRSKQPHDSPESTPANVGGSCLGEIKLLVPFPRLLSKKQAP